MQIAELCYTVQDNCIQRSAKIVLEWILNSAGVKFILFTSREYWNNRQQTFKIMKENPTLVIELGSHTDCRASKAYNKSLSLFTKNDIINSSLKFIHLVQCNLHIKLYIL